MKRTFSAFFQSIFEAWAHPNMVIERGKSNRLGYLLFLNSVIWLLIAVPVLLVLFYKAKYVTGYISVAIIAGTTLFSIICIRVRERPGLGVHVSVFSSCIVNFIFCYSNGGISSPFIGCIPLMTVPVIFMVKKEVYMHIAFAFVLLAGLVILPFHESPFFHSIDIRYRTAFIIVFLVMILPYYFFMLLSKMDLELLLRRVIKKKQDQLLQNEKMVTLGQLTAGIAHEINNPLNFLTGNAQAMELDVIELSELIEQISDPLKGDKKKELGAINTVISEMKLLTKGMTRGGERISEIVKLMRSYTESSTVFQQIDITTLINTAIDHLTEKAKSKNVEVELNIGSSSLVNCDMDRIVETISSLMENAIDVSPHNSCINIDTYEEEAQAVIRIQDHGIGISEENQKRIFDPFFTTKDVGAGQGLGLFISYKTIKEHKGHIELSSEVGRGSTFRIYLPITNNT